MIFFNSLYVAAEFATVSSRRTKISQMAGQGNRMAQALLPFIEDRKTLDRYVAACQIGITISSLVLGAFGQNVIATAITPTIAALLDALPSLTNLLGGDTASASLALARSISITLVLVIITTLQVIFGELFPKSVAIQYPERIAMAVVWPMKISLKLFSPLIWLFNGSGSLVLRLLGHKGKDKPAHVHSPEEIELLVSESYEGGLLDGTERQMLRNAFRLRDLTAKQVMLHRTKIIAAPVDSTVLEIIDLAIKVGFSRIPLYRKSIDDIVGFVHVKDLFRLHTIGETELTKIIREVEYLPETLSVMDVWKKLNTRRKYLTIVFDEFGGTAGLITFEDLIEEIFGELQDEFDDEMALIARDQDGRIYLRGDLLVTDVNEYLELNLPAETDTLSGLVFSTLGRPPIEGDEVIIDGIMIRVEALEDLGVRELSLVLPVREDSGSTFTEWEVADHD